MSNKYYDKGFVLVQLALFAVYFIRLKSSIGFPLSLKYIGLLFAGIGFLVLVVAILNLDRNLTPYPSPKTNAALITTGLYKYVRHPIYSGIILLFTGYSLYKDSWYKLGIAFLLIVLFHFKTLYEEARLSEKFTDYKNYKKKTGKFLPKL